MKRVLTVGLVSLMCIALLTPAAWAGAKQRHRWEGVAIGVGAAILGHALIHGPHHYNRPYRGGGTVIIHRERDRCDFPRYRYRRHHHRPAHASRWKTRRIWISPVYEKVWNPGHFDVDQRWVPGRWINVVKEPGHWAEKREWAGRP